MAGDQLRGYSSPVIGAIGPTVDKEDRRPFTFVGNTERPTVDSQQLKVSRRSHTRSLAEVIISQGSLSKRSLTSDPAHFGAAIGLTADASSAVDARIGS